jgi:Tol biopolymer transport system component
MRKFTSFTLLILALFSVLAMPSLAQPPAPPDEDGGRSGDTLAFISNRGGDYELYIANLQTNVLRQLTDNDAEDWYADWAPYTLQDRSTGSVSTDGSGHLAFASNRDGDYEIFLMPADCDYDPEGCADAWQITNNEASDLNPVWSPSTSPVGLVFVSDRDGDQDIYLRVIDGSGRMFALTDNAASDKDPAWAPDGSGIYYATESDGDYEIAFTAIGGDGGPQTLTDNDADDESPFVSPTGQQIAFSTNRDGNYEIYVMDSDGQNPTRLTNDAGDDFAFGWSPDGERIAFASDRDGDYEIYIVDADGKNLRQITANNAGDLAPVWAPPRIAPPGEDQDTPTPSATSRDTLTPSATPAPQQCRITSSGNVNIRSGPGTNYPILGILTASDQLIATGQNGRWFATQFNGQPAWVAGWVTQQGGSCQNLPFVAAPLTPVPPTDTPTPTPLVVTIPPTTPAPAGSVPVCSPPPDPQFRTVYNNNPTLASRLGCPVSNHPRVGPKAYTMNSAYQRFEDGQMIWLQNLGWYKQAKIYTLFGNGSYMRFNDTWDSSMPESAGLTPPSGQIEPIRGFGKVWREQNLRDDLGWATIEEQAGDATYQNFANGQMIHITQTDDTYIFLMDTNLWYVR